MSNFLKRLEIEMETKIFSFLLIFFIIFIGVDIVSIIIMNFQTFWVIYWYLIPMIITLIFAGVLIDRQRRSWILLLLIPEGLLQLVAGFVIADLVALSIIWCFIGILSGFTISAILGFFAGVSTIDQRGKVTGVIGGIAWIVSGIILSWISSTIFQLSGFMLLMFVFAAIKLTGAGVSVYILFAKTEETGDSTIRHDSEGEGFLGIVEESYGHVWNDPKFRTYLIAMVLICFAQGLFLPIGGAAQETIVSYQYMASIGFAAGGLFLFMTGTLLDKGRKQILFYGTILATISFLSYYFPIGAVFIAGFPVVLITTIIVISDIAPADKRARYYSVFLSIILLAFFFGFLIGLAVAPGTVWVALICIILTLIALILIHLKGEESNLEEVTFPVTSTPTTTPSTETSSPESFSADERDSENPL